MYLVDCVHDPAPVHRGRVKPPVSRPPARLAFLQQMEQHELSAIQEVDTPGQHSLDTGTPAPLMSSSVCLTPCDQSVLCDWLLQSCSLLTRASPAARLCPPAPLKTVTVRVKGHRSRAESAACPGEKRSYVTPQPQRVRNHTFTAPLGYKFI